MEEILKILESSDIEDASTDDESFEDPTWKPKPVLAVPCRSASNARPNAENPDEPSCSNTTAQAPSQTPQRRLIWKHKSFQSKPQELPTDQTCVGPLPRLPLEYFKMYYPDSFFDLGAEYSNRYYLAKTGKSINATAERIKQLYGMHAVMGCIKYPRVSMYWKRGVELQLISSVMPRDEFFALRSSLHFVNAEVTPAEAETNKLWKVQPVIDAVRKRCLELERAPGPYSVDEQMIPFTGRCSMRQYVKGKPRPVGLKNFVITTSRGLVVDFEIYQGKTTRLADVDIGLGAGVVLRLTETLSENSRIYFDRYFTSIPLMDALRRKNLEGTGTIMPNRLRSVTFLPDKDMKQGEFQELCRQDNEVAVAKWRDSKSVVMASTCSGSSPVQEVKRWSKTTKSYCQVSAPAVVCDYNRHMGGVDICDQMMECYRTWIKTRKWTLKVILHFMDLAIVNAWMEYREDSFRNNIPKKHVMDLLAFRMSLGEALINTRKRRKPLTELQMPDAKKPRVEKLPVPEKRLDGYDHWPVVDDIANARLCRREGCDSRTRTRCDKCNIYLCLSGRNNCFKMFHTKK